jgi:hypothetical protein
MSTLDSLKMTDNNNNFFTRNWWNNALSIIKKAISDNKPYKVYTALLTQTGSNAPTAIVLENTLGSELVWTRNVAGTYSATLTNAFPEVKTFILTPSDGGYDSDVLRTGGGDPYKLFRNSDDEIILVLAYDDILNNTPIEVRVYN